MNVSEVPRSVRSIGLSSRSGAAGAASGTASASNSGTSRGAAESSVGAWFLGVSDMGTFLIRCLESELYATIVALSTILQSALIDISFVSFDDLYPVTCPGGHAGPAPAISQNP